MKSMLIKSVFTLGVVSYMCLWGSYVSAAEQQNIEEESRVEIKEKIFSRRDAIEYKDKDTVKIPDGYTKIAADAFKDFVHLTSVEIPGSVKTIGMSAFAKCKNLSSVTLADGVEWIRENAFAFCENLKDIELPVTIKYIDDYAFMMCDSLTYVRLPEKLETLGKGAFSLCSNLKSVDLLSCEDLRKIGNAAFYGLRSLNDIRIGCDITANIGNQLFDGCSVRDITVLKDVKKIPDKMFSSFKAVSQIVGPKCIIDQSSKLFSEEVNRTILKVVFAAVFSQEDAEKYKDQDNVKIPDDCTEIAAGAFKDFVHLTSVEIPGSVKTIGKHAFEGCERLSSVTLANGVERIGFGAFGTCKNLESIHLPSSIKVIGDYAFKECEELKHVQLPKNLELLGKGAFESCRKLRSVDLLSGKLLTSIGDMAFYGANLLEDIFIGDDIQANIGNELFELCNVTTIRVSPDVKEITAGMFSACKAVKSIIGPKCIIDQCSKLFSEEVNSTISKHVINDENITSTVPLVFSSDDRKMAREILDENGDVIGMEIPAGYTSIASDAFDTNDKKRFKKIVIPHSVVEIQTGAFSGFGSLEEAKLPNQFMKIDRTALFPDSDSVKIEETPFSIPGEKARTGTEPSRLKTYEAKSENLKKTNSTSVEVEANRTFKDKNIKLELQSSGLVTVVPLLDKSESITIPYRFAVAGGNTVLSETEKLRKVTIAAGPSNEINSLFALCNFLDVVCIESGVKAIGDYMFKGCVFLKEIEIPTSVEWISPTAFIGCTSLETIKIEGIAKSVEVDSDGTIATNSGTLVDFFKKRGYLNVKKSIGFSLAQKKSRKKNRF